MYLLFLGVWIILNAKITMEILIFGLVISAVMFAFTCRFMDYSIQKEKMLLCLIPLLVKYFAVLIEEIVKANVAVLKIIFSPDMEPEPAFVYFDTNFKTGMAKMLLANSITLTPGTITVSVEGNRFCVHCLDESMGEGLEDCVFVELIKKMEVLEEKWNS